ncbi:uncharacterized protein V6R79_001618 [Siganus canaliculatus]
MVGLFFVLFLSWGLVNSNPVEIHLICSQQPITALVGGDVILPCHLQPPVSAADWTVEWSKPGLNPESVHYHENGRAKFEEQNPSYSFRTRLFVNDMKTGNVSVKIFDVEESDSGIYKCFLPSIQKEASIKLIVEERRLICSQQPITALFGDDVILPCHLQPPVSAADWTVEWSKPGLDPESVHYHEDGRLRVKEQNPFYSHRTSLSVNDMKTGDVSLTIFDLKKNDSGIYKCFLPSIKKEASIELIVVERRLICSQQPITALVGDDVILPCHLQPPVSAADWTVEWSKPGLDPESVHYHEDGRQRVKGQNPSFSDRTSLSVDDMKTGDVSLRIFNVVKNDSGIYKCFLPSIKTEASIELIVERRATEEANARVEAEDRATNAERRATEEANARVEAEDRATNAENKATEEAKARVEAEDRATYARRRAIEENIARATYARRRATEAENKATEETSMCFEYNVDCDWSRTTGGDGSDHDDIESQVLSSSRCRCDRAAMSRPLIEHSVPVTGGASSVALSSPPAPQFILTTHRSVETSTTVERHLICSQKPITALAGDDVILPCHLQPPVSAADWTVEWSKPGLDPESVHYHENGRLKFEEQNPSYSFRTRLFVNDMKTGNVSVKIFDVEKSDSGIYTCFLPSIKKEASIELIVVERQLICSQQPITALVGDDVILPCHLQPPVSAADWTVEWSKPGLDPESVHYHEDGRLRVKEQNPSYSYRTSLSVDDMKTGDVSLRIFNVEKSDSGIYKCFLPSIKKEASIELIVGGSTTYRDGCDVMACGPPPPFCV